MSSRKFYLGATSAALICCVVTAFITCTVSDKDAPSFAAARVSFIEMDGSSTVFPIAQAVINSYSFQRPDVKLSLSMSGTSNGFMKFCQGKLDINNASRPITEEEIAMCERNGVHFLELKIGYDAIVVAVNPANNWCRSLDITQLRDIWFAGDSEKIRTWHEVNPSWPTKPITFYGPGRMSGTQDLFLKCLFDTSLSNTRKMTTSEDHNDVVMSISRDTFAMGFFAFPYLHSNYSFVNPLEIDDLDSTNGNGPVLPSLQAIESHSYMPLQRPLYLYINKSILASQEYYDFLNFFLAEARRQSAELGYGPLAQEEIKDELKKLESERTAITAPSL